MVRIAILAVVTTLTASSLLCAQQFDRSELKRIANRQTKLIQQKSADNSLRAKFISPVKRLPLVYEQSNLQAATAVGNSDIWLGGIAGLSLTGSGRTIGYWDKNSPLLTHQEFSNRVFFVDTASTSSTNNHATQMVGSMVASGTNQDAKGMAYEAEVNAYNWDNDTGEMAHAAADSSLQLSEHPYAAIAGWTYNYRGDDKWTWYSDTSASESKPYQFGYYDSQARNWDEIIYNAPTYLIVKSAGNARGDSPDNQPVDHWIPETTESGISWKLSNDQRPVNGGTNGFETLTSASVAKNLIVVGAVKSTTGNFDNLSSIVPLGESGFGPTDDGRIKPDLVAPGHNLFTTGSESNTDYSTSGGTSAASAVLAGSAALLQQHYANITGQAISAATLRTVFMQTADDLGATGPDYKFGWGLVNTERAARFLSAWGGISEELLLEEHTLMDGQAKQFSFQAGGKKPLKFTIGWTDPAGTVPSQLNDPTNKLLVNDLDLRVEDPDGNIVKPWVLDRSQPGMVASKEDNSVDNVEQVMISNATSGTYTLTVSHKGSLQNGSQKVSVVGGPAEPAIVFRTIADGAWSQSSSWEGGQIPGTSFHRAEIVNQIQLDQDAEIGGVTFEGSGSLQLSSQALTLYGDIINENGGAGFKGNKQSKLIVEKNTDFSDPLVFTSRENKLGKLLVRLPSTDTLNIGNAINIYSELSVQSGILNTQENAVTLVSGSNQAAVLDVAAGEIEGAVHYSRLFNEDKSGWRLLSVPFDNILFSSLADSFHTQGGPWAEDVISEPQSSSDQAANLWFFDELNQSYNGYYGSDSTFVRGDGYLFYMYANEPDNTSILPASWKISGHEPTNLTVSLHRGSSNADSYNLVGNPFAGVLDWHKIVDNNPGLNSTYAIWDPAETEGGGTSGFKYYSRTDQIGAAGRYIAPVQGFFVTATQTGANLSFSKGQKVSDESPNIFGKQSTRAASAHIQLQLYDDQSRLLDGEIYMVFTDAVIQGKDPSDVMRLGSLSGNVKTLSFKGPDGNALAFEGRSIKTEKEVFDLVPQIAQPGNYAIKWPRWHNIPQNWDIILRDGKTGRRINMRQQNQYEFRYQSNTEKQLPSRQQTALPKEALANQKENARFRIEILRAGNSEDSPLPNQFKVEQNYPNPFNPSTSIPYKLPEASHVTIRVYNILGKEVMTLVDEEKPAGSYEAFFDGSKLASGFYFYRIKAGDFVEAKAMTLIK